MSYGYTEKVELGAGMFRLYGSIGVIFFLLGVLILLKNLGQLPFVF